MIYEFDIFFFSFFPSFPPSRYCIFLAWKRGFGARIYGHEDEWKAWRKLEALRIMDKRWINESIVGEASLARFVLENWSLSSLRFSSENELTRSWRDFRGFRCLPCYIKWNWIFWIINFGPVEVVVETIGFQISFVSKGKFILSFMEIDIRLNR